MTTATSFMPLEATARKALNLSMQRLRLMRKVSHAVPYPHSRANMPTESSTSLSAMFSRKKRLLFIWRSCAESN